MSYVEKLRLWPEGSAPAWSGIWPLSIGYRSCNRITMQQNQGYYCFHIVEKGSILYQYGDSYDADDTLAFSENIKQGEVFVTRPDNTFEYILSKNNETTMIYWIRIVGSLTEEFFRAMGFTDHCFHFQVLQPKKIISCFETLFDLCENYRTDSNINILSELYKFIYLTRNDTQENTKGIPAAEILDFMYREIDRGLNIQELCDTFSISRSTMFLKLKNSYGKCPIQLLDEIRIRKAREYLESTSLPLNKIALLCGHSGINQFIRHFKKHTGFTPDYYRKNHLSK